MSRHTCQVWLRRAKSRLIWSVPEVDQAGLRKRLSRVGYHAPKRSKVREREFRALPPPIQVAYVGTDYRTLVTIYDNIAPEDQRAVFEEVRTRRSLSNTGGELDAIPDRVASTTAGSKEAGA